MNRFHNASILGLIAGAAIFAATAPVSAQVKSADELLAATDTNGDGKIQRAEYVEWCAHKGAADFNAWSGGAASMTPADAFENYKKILSYVD